MSQHNCQCLVACNRRSKYGGGKNSTEYGNTFAELTHNPLHSIEKMNSLKHSRIAGRNTDNCGYPYHRNDPSAGHKFCQFRILRMKTEKDYFYQLCHMYMLKKSGAEQPCKAAYRHCYFYIDFKQRKKDDDNGGNSRKKRKVIIIGEDAERHTVPRA